MCLRLAPPLRRCVANVRLKVWGVTFFLIRARSRSFRSVLSRPMLFRRVPLLERKIAEAESGWLVASFPRATSR